MKKEKADTSLGGTGASLPFNIESGEDSTLRTRAQTIGQIVDRGMIDLTVYIENHG